METAVIQNPDLVVAIDVGSTYSGYAWQYRSDFLKNRSNVEFNLLWGEGSPQVHKTNSAILLKITQGKMTEQETVEVVALGYSAERIYGEIMSTQPAAGEKDERDMHHLFKNFKLMLYQLKDGNTDIPNVEDTRGTHYLLSDVMSSFIGALQDHFLEKIENKLNIDTTLWVVTVPALWSQKAKQFMREAAEKSGLGRNHLILATEPEAASIYCINLPEEQIKQMNNIDQPGHKFLTVDIGGGTADLSANEVLQNGKLKELCAERGMCVGGQNVNEAFFQALLNCFEGGNHVQKLFLKATPIEMWRLYHKFEQLKLQIGSGQSVGELFTVPLPSDIKEALRTKQIKVNDKDNLFIVQDAKKLKFKSKFIREKLFQQSGDMICKIVDEVLTKDKGIQTVVLVGGFAESKITVDYLRTALQKKYPTIKIVAPTSPFRAVLKGAVLYGHDVFIYKSRISRATYGVATNQIFEEGKHRPEKKWYHSDDGIYRCKDILDVHIHEDHAVNLLDEQPCQTYTPLYKNQRSIELSIYTYKKRGNNGAQAVVYTTDEGCKSNCKIKVELPEDADNKDWKVNVTMIYGGTQLYVIAKCSKTGKEYPACIKF